MLEIGDKAPDFVLRDQDNKLLRLADLAGSKVVLSFHPLAFTPVCSLQMQDLEKNHEAFTRLNSVALGVNVDQVNAKAAWARELGIRHTRLLSDFWPHGEVAEKFGILRREGFSERAVFVLDEKGVIIFAKLYRIKELPDIKEILAVLEK